MKNRINTMSDIFTDYPKHGELPNGCTEFLTDEAQNEADMVFEALQDALDKAFRINYLRTGELITLAMLKATYRNADGSLDANGKRRAQKVGKHIERMF